MYTNLKVVTQYPVKFASGLTIKIEGLFYVKKEKVIFLFECLALF